MEIQIRQGTTIIVPECRDAAITCWVNEDTDTLMQLKIANFYSVAWPAYFTSIRGTLTKTTIGLFKGHQSIQKGFLLLSSSVQLLVYRNLYEGHLQLT